MRNIITSLWIIFKCYCKYMYQNHTYRTVWEIIVMVFGIVYGVKEHSTGVFLILLVLAFLPRFIRWLFYCFLEAVGDYGLQRKGLTRKCRRMRFKSYMDQEINKEIENS